ERAVDQLDDFEEAHLFRPLQEPEPAVMALHRRQHFTLDEMLQDPAEEEWGCMHLVGNLVRRDMTIAVEPRQVDHGSQCVVRAPRHDHGFALRVRWPERRRRSEPTYGSASRERDLRPRPNRPIARNMPGFAPSGGFASDSVC